MQLVSTAGACATFFLTQNTSEISMAKMRLFWLSQSGTLYLPHTINVQEVVLVTVWQRHINSFHSMTDPHGTVTGPHIQCTETVQQIIIQE